MAQCRWCFQPNPATSRSAHRDSPTGFTSARETEDTERPPRTPSSCHPCRPFRRWVGHAARSPVVIRPGGKARREVVAADDFAAAVGAGELVRACDQGASVSVVLSQGPGGPRTAARPIPVWSRLARRGRRRGSPASLWRPTTQGTVSQYPADPCVPVVPLVQCLSVTLRADPHASFALAHQFKAREARDHFKELMDRAESGGVAVLRRNSTMVLVERDVLDSALAAQHPFDVKVSFSDGQISMWIGRVPVHGVGESYDEAEEDFLDALVDYAETWVTELRFAPNHKTNAGLVKRVLMFAGDRDELRRVVFGDE